MGVDSNRQMIVALTRIPVGMSAIDGDPYAAQHQPLNSLYLKRKMTLYNSSIYCPVVTTRQFTVSRTIQTFYDPSADHESVSEYNYEYTYYNTRYNSQ